MAVPFKDDYSIEAEHRIATLLQKPEGQEDLAGNLFADLEVIGYRPPLRYTDVALLMRTMRQYVDVPVGLLEKVNPLHRSLRVTEMAETLGHYALGEKDFFTATAIAQYLHDAPLPATLRAEALRSEIQEGLVADLRDGPQ